MFSLNHIIFLIISVILIVGFSYLSKRYKWPLNKVLLFCCIFSVISETTKIFSSLVEDSTGAYLDPFSLPFHLCTIQIYLLFYCLLSKNEKGKEIVFSFMFPTQLVGAIMALLIPTEEVLFTTTYAYYAFLFHSMLVFFAIYLVRNKIITVNLKSLMRNVGLLLALVFVNICINSVLSIYDTNFMFLRRPPIEGLPILNLDNGWVVYFISLIALGVVLFGLLHLPFIIIDYKKNKLLKQNVSDTTTLD
jgi:hypothetical integral membrane protein (TIGR02206 family)